VTGGAVLDSSDVTTALSIDAESREARRASLWLERVGAARRAPADCIRRLDHCLDEALANVILHGGPDTTSRAISLQFAVRYGPGMGEATLTVSDGGPAFDPLAVKPKARPTTLAEAEPRGLGIFMMRDFADRLDYRRSDGQNHLSFTVVWPIVLA
jgi:serine/threonine-protein kinase RsbW